MLGYGWLGFLSGAFLLLALFAPLHYLLLIDLCLVALRGEWQIAGILFDPSDLAFAALALGLLFRTRRVESEGERIVTYLPLWVILTLLLSTAYLVAPINRDYLTDPVRVVYQLYRYCWRFTLFYPLAALLLTTRERLKLATMAILVGGGLCSAQAIPQGFAGYRATGPFTSGNTLGGVLIVPILISLHGLISDSSRGRQIAYGMSLLVFLRALVFSGSRGAFVALLIGAGVLLALLFVLGATRRRILTYSLAGGVVFFALVLASPNIASGPNVGRLLTALSSGTEAGNFQWRLTERWPYFWGRIMEHPWFGVGTDVDESLGPMGTPHNGYLAVAATYGLPALLAFVLFLVLGLGAGLRAMRRCRDPGDRTMAALCVAGLSALAVHNMVDALFLIPFIAKMVWLLVAATALLRTSSPEVADERSALGDRNVADVLGDSPT